MTCWPVGLVIIILVTICTVAGDRTSVKLCPCTQGCCEANWFQYKDSCYLPMKTPQSWRDAEETCAAQNADLASVHTSEEDQFIFHLMGHRGSYWLGAKKNHSGHDSHWTWTDNSSWQYALMKLRSKSHLLKNHVIVGRSDDDDDDDDDHNNGRISWDYARAERKHFFVCKYLLV